MISTKEFQSLLNELQKKSGAFGVLVITRDGKLVEAVGFLHNVNTVALAALVAGMFAATKEVARLVGEEHFSILLQQGEKRHIHISLFRSEIMLVILFEDHHRIGLIRTYAKEYAPKINEMLNLVTQSPKRIEEERFQEYALSLIDQIFSEE